MTLTRNISPKREEALFVLATSKTRPLLLAIACSAVLVTLLRVAGPSSSVWLSPWPFWKSLLSSAVPSSATSAVSSSSYSSSLIEDDVGNGSSLAESSSSSSSSSSSMMIRRGGVNDQGKSHRERLEDGHDATLSSFSEDDLPAINVEEIGDRVEEEEYNGNKNLQKEKKKITVPVNVYVESLCIYSKGFFESDLVPAFNSLGYAGIMDLDVVVFGNARIVSSDNDNKIETNDSGDAAEGTSPRLLPRQHQPNHQVECQHGVAECDANSYDQCVKFLYPDVYRHLPYVACLFDALPMGRNDDPFDASYFEECAERDALLWESISNCRQDPVLTWSLQMRSRREQPLNVTHVPWIVVDGEYLERDEETLHDAVCKAFVEKGGSHPLCASPNEKN